MLPRHALPLLVGIALTSTASADEGEVEVALQPFTGFLARHGRLNTGLGGELRVAYGLRDDLAVGLHTGCDTFLSLAEPVEWQQARARHFYDTQRCDVVPSVVGRAGARLVTSLDAGLGYRLEHVAARQVVAENHVLLAKMPTASNHMLIAMLRGALEFRPWDLLSGGVWLKSTLQVTGASPELDLGAGLSLTVYFYP